MFVTLLGIMVFLHPATNILDDFSMIALQLLRESYIIFPSSTTISVSSQHPKNGADPMLVTLLPILTEVSLVQHARASSPMLVTLLGIVMEVSLVQYARA